MKPLQESLVSRIKNKIQGKPSTIFDIVPLKKMVRGVNDWPMLVIKKYHDVVNKKIERALPDIFGPINAGPLNNEMLSTRDEIAQRFEDFVVNELLNNCGKDVIKNCHDAVRIVVRIGQYRDAINDIERLNKRYDAVGNMIGMYLEGGEIISIEW